MQSMRPGPANHAERDSSQRMIELDFRHPQTPQDKIHGTEDNASSNLQRLTKGSIPGDQEVSIFLLSSTLPAQAEQSVRCSPGISKLVDRRGVEVGGDAFTNKGGYVLYFKL